MVDYLNSTPSKNDNSEIVQSILREYERLSSQRMNFNSHWREISERILPMHKDAFQSNGMFSGTKGNKRNELIYDSTAATALNRFSAILDSLLTPRNQTWHRLTANNEKINEDRDVRLWFDEVNRLLFKYRYMPTANFALQNHQVFKSIGAYGTACLFSDQLDGEPGLRYRNVNLSEIFIDENHQGRVDKALRYFPMTARQAVQKWSLDVVPEKIKNAANKCPEEEYFFIHCVRPRSDYDPQRKDYKGMKFASYYVSVEGQVLLSEGGFTTFPYSISRYEQAPGEVYGRSPAMDVLPAIKTLNEQKKTMLRQGHRVVDPVLLVHDDGVVDTFSLKPGSINAGGVTSDGRPLVHALPTGRLDFGKELMDDERAVINDAFLVSLFQILVESPQMTATEVLERTREKGILLAPKLGGVEAEYLGSVIDRDLDLLSFQNILPPMPPLLLEAKGEYRIIYDSPLSRAQRSEEAAGLMRTIESTLNIVNVTQNQAPLDHFNWDEIVPGVANIQGVPEKWMRSLEDIQSIRQGRAEQMQQQQAIQAAPATASVVSALSKTQKSAG